jgi:hypothetical protein
MLRNFPIRQLHYVGIYPRLLSVDSGFIYYSRYTPGRIILGLRIVSSSRYLLSLFSQTEYLSSFYSFLHKQVAHYTMFLGQVFHVICL